MSDTAENSPSGLWQCRKDGTFSADISALSANGWYKDGSVLLPYLNGKRFALKDATVDLDDDHEIMGWRFTCEGLNYLVVND